MSIRRRLRSILWRVPVEQEVREEMAHHLDLRTQELIDRGLDPARARVEALRRMGDLEDIQDQLVRLGRDRDETLAWREWLDELRHDIRFALRQARRNPGFTAAALLTLALGIGSTTAIFSIVYAVILRPFPFPDPARVLYVSTTWREQPGGTSGGNFDYLRRHTTSLEHLAAGFFPSFNLADGDTPERVQGMQVTSNYFQVFGVPPLHGRTFVAEEDRPGQEGIVVLSYRLWQRRFGGAPTIVGREIRLNSQAYQVVGVMPAAFDEIAGTQELWVPARFTPERLAMFDEHFLVLYGLRQAKVTLAQVNDDLRRVAEGLRRDHPEFNSERGAEARVYGDFVTSDFSTRLFVLLGAVALVLIIACGNVANLLLARLAARSRELAIHAAIGAGRGRIVRQVLTESVLLSSLGALAGVLLAYGALPALIASAPVGVPRLAVASLSAPVLAAAVMVALVSALLVGLLPAWHATRGHDVRNELGEGKGALGGSIRPWVRQTLIAGQAALVLVVLAGAALLVRSAINLQRVSLGFDVTGTLSARIGLTGPAYRDPERVKTRFAQLLEILQTAPGVRMAALDSQAPLLGQGGGNALFPEGRPITMETGILSRSHFVTPDYFRALRIPLKAGRGFTSDDLRAAPLVMVISETVARQAFGTDNPIGKRISCCEGGPNAPSWKTVVGVVADVRSRGPAEEPRPEFYLPLSQIPDVAWGWIGNSLNVIVRPEAGEPAAMAGLVRDAVRQIDPTIPVYNITTFEEGLRRTTAQARFNTTLMTALGLTGLFLAALGIYSVIAWLVAQRTREIGVRMALGASVREVVGQMIMHGLRPVAAGLIIGLVGAFATTRLLEQQLFQVNPRDPLTLGVAMVLLLIVAVCASLVPAWRATRIDPATALRDA
ncbi:MAG: ABC transporter permease [Acidobacteria bacterium]|nr:ABC transporter permease [Acidobacteriota bacterium]